ncbi:hypothetical protein [Tsukamurella hominis]|uniref:hypothetical protein n=1 Tax=Tsukamurella hominis TaxID=1970232 RepID=UPI0039E74542
MSPEAITVGAFRWCPHGCGMNYRGKLEGQGLAAVSAVVDAAVRTGNIDVADGRPSAATLDVLDGIGDIIGDYSIPTEQAWAWWVTAAELTLTATDCRTCDPVIWQATDPARRTLAAVGGER